MYDSPFEGFDSWYCDLRIAHAAIELDEEIYLVVEVEAFRDIMNVQCPLCFFIRPRSSDNLVSEVDQSIPIILPRDRLKIVSDLRLRRVKLRPDILAPPELIHGAGSITSAARVG